MEFTYKSYITLDEFKNETGYDLTKRLQQGDFSNMQQAADVFMQDNFDELKRLIASKMGTYWTDNFYSDILTDAATDTTINAMANGLRQALKEHLIYRFEIGDAVACANKDLPRYSDRMIETLTLYRILPRGV